MVMRRKYRFTPTTTNWPHLPFVPSLKKQMTSRLSSITPPCSNANFTENKNVFLSLFFPSYAYHKVGKYEKERVANDSTYWLIFELLVRDFFRYSAVKNGNSIFHLGGSRRDAGKQPWLDNAGFLEAWKAGMTGYPFIDANMRELKACGFMSNR